MFTKYLVVAKGRGRRELRELMDWRLVYCRRKVGKTYLATRCLDFDDYYLITRGLAVLPGDEKLQLDEGVKQVIKSLKEGKTVILDEF